MSDSADEPLSSDPATRLAQRLNRNRNRVLAGEHIPPEEYKELIDDFRAMRMSAATATAKSKRGGNNVPLDLEAL